MTHPITPPPELVQQWLEELYGGPVFVISPFDQRVLIAVAQWGADTELEACCEYVYERLKLTTVAHIAQDLRTSRRPKPPSLKKRALEAMHRNWNPHNNDDFATIARALEQLPE